MSEAGNWENNNVAGARREVDMGLKRFESSLEKLETKVTNSREKVQRAADIAYAPLRLAKEAAGQARRLGDTFLQRAQQNPKPVVFGAVTVLGGIMLLSYLARRRT